MEKHSRLWELMAKRMAGALTAPEQAELDVLLAADREVAQQQQLLEKISLNSTGKLDADQKEVLLDRIMGDIATAGEEQPRPRRRWPYLAAAAVGVVLLGGTLLAFLQRQRGGNKAVVWSTVQTKPGSKTRITLPDGTLVVLNAGSSLSYPNDFAKEWREVKLTGEGYFDVAKMADHPFVIHTHTVDVKVLGTTFNVRAYGDESHTETALISGTVEVTIKDAGKQHITLSPHQKLLVANVITQAPAKQHRAAMGDLKPLIILEGLEEGHRDSVIQETAWIDNRFVYRDENFEKLIKRIERWYGVTVECRNRELLQSSFTGNVQEESLDQLLGVLQQTKHFEYSINAGKVVIN